MKQHTEDYKISAIKYLIVNINHYLDGLKYIKFMGM